MPSYSDIYVNYFIEVADQHVTSKLEHASQSLLQRLKPVYLFVVNYNGATGAEY